MAKKTAKNTKTAKPAAKVVKKKVAGQPAKQVKKAKPATSVKAGKPAAKTMKPAEAAKPTKPAGAVRFAASMMDAATAEVTQTFTGVVVCQGGRAILNGSLLTTESGCDQSGFDDAFNQFCPSSGRAITVSGTAGRCQGRDVIHVA